MRPGKRLFDVVGASAGLIVLAPLFAAIALAIVAIDGPPVFFRQERIGRGALPFRIWKFRTMVRNADRIGGALTVGRDQRITRVGRFLRAFKLDELPQLLNVLAGEMTFVGPRPEMVRYVALYTASERQVLELVPGITDQASLKYRDEARALAAHADPEHAYVTEIMPDKIRLNLAYAGRATLRSDLWMIVRTLSHLGR